jgi:uncharacterized membrane protein
MSGRAARAFRFIVVKGAFQEGFMRVISHRKHAVNIAQPERWISAVAGGLAAVAGLRRRSPAGAALILAGGDLIRRAVTGHSHLYEAMGIRTAPKGQGAGTTSVPYELGVRVDKAITIGRPRHEVYQFWRDLGNLARFMDNVESVRDLGDGRSHWIVKGPAGRRVEWDAVVHNQTENEMIAWRSLPGADVDNAGAVWFKDAPGGRGTEVKVEFQYNPPAGIVGAAVASLWGKEPGLQVERDLRRLRQILEAGEVITTDGQTSGREITRPAERRTEREVEFASQGSFPASDAPAYNP